MALGYVYLWAFEVRPEAADRFCRIYGEGGAWVALFRRAPGYVGTQLLQDRDNPRRFLTIDAWDSAESHAAFRRQFATEFDALDRECGTLTERETSLGEFDVR